MFERGQERREVGFRSRSHPNRSRPRGGARHLGAEIRGHPHRLVVFAPTKTDESGGVGVVPERLGERRALVEQPPHFGIDEQSVLKASQRCEMLGTRLRPGGGHHRVLIPAEDAPDPLGIDDLCGASLEPLRRVSHVGSVTAGAGQPQRPARLLHQGPAGPLQLSPEFAPAIALC